MFLLTLSIGYIELLKFGQTHIHFFSFFVFIHTVHWLNWFKQVELDALFSTFFLQLFIYPLSRSLFNICKQLFFFHLRTNKKDLPWFSPLLVAHMYSPFPISLSLSFYFYSLQVFTIRQVLYFKIVCVCFVWSCLRCSRRGWKPCTKICVERFITGINREYKITQSDNLFIRNPPIRLFAVMISKIC